MLNETYLYIWSILKMKLDKKTQNPSSLSVGHYELCRDDIGDLLGSPEHLWLRENANEIG